MFQDQRVGDHEQKRDGQLAGIEQGALGIRMEERRENGPGFLQQTGPIALDLDIDDNLTAYYRLMNVIHTQGYTHADSVEAMRNFYGNYPGLSDINEAARRTILRYIGNFLGNISVEDYSEYFELSKIFPIYTDLFGNQQFNQSLKAICLRYIKRLLKRFTDKRGKDYQDIKKFVNTSFIDLGFMKPKELVEMFKTKRKKKSTTA